MTADRSVCPNCHSGGVQFDQNIWALVRIEVEGDPAVHDNGDFDFSMGLRVKAAVCNQCDHVYLFAIRPN